MIIITLTLLLVVYLIWWTPKCPKCNKRTKEKSYGFGIESTYYQCSNCKDNTEG